MICGRSSGGRLARFGRGSLIRARQTVIIRGTNNKMEALFEPSTPSLGPAFVRHSLLPGDGAGAAALGSRCRVEHGVLAGLPRLERIPHVSVPDSVLRVSLRAAAGRLAGGPRRNFWKGQNVS